MYKILTIGEFYDIFKPEQNIFLGPDRGEWHEYETFGKELEYVMSVLNDPAKGEKYVWTEIEVDEGKDIVTGFIEENPQAYWVCAVPSVFPVTQKVVGEYQIDCICSDEGIDPEDCDICSGSEYQQIQFNSREDIVSFFGEELGNQLV